jgi:O-antigen/teichoic acid export membrane protein
MKVVTNYLTKNVIEKFLQWFKLVAVTISTQALIQVLGLLSGILIIRLLPTTEYAFYTLANTMLGTMTVLADGGISSGVMAEGGKVWTDSKKLGIVIATGFKLRRTFAVFSLLISMPILFYLLRSHGANLITSFLIVFSLIPSFYAALSDNLLEISLKLHQGINKLQRNQLFTGIWRFIMISGSLFIFPWTFVAILGNGLPRMWANIKLRKLSNDYAKPVKQIDPLVEKEILSVVRRSLPGSIYYCVSSQITIWLISMFGSTKAIAHLGAIGRIAVVITIFTTLFNTLIIPRYARLQENRKVLRWRFFQIQIVLLLISIFVVATVMTFPSQILWILGSGYANLKTEIVLMAISSCLAMLSSVTYFTMVSRGWIIKPVINISINILFQVILIFTMDVSKTKNVLLFSIVDFLVSYLILWIYFFYRIQLLKVKNNS